MKMQKYYRVSEEDLIAMLSQSLEMQALNASGVDNWTWYGDNFREFIQEEYAWQEIGDEYEEDAGFEDLAKAIIKKKYEDSK